MNKFARRLGVGSLAVATVPAFAAIDIAAASAGIADASVAVLAVLALMITMSAAVYGVKKVLGLIGR